MKFRKKKEVGVIRRKDHLTAEQRRRVMQSNRSIGTSPELKMAGLLRGARIRFRRHLLHLPGKPDFHLIEAKMVIFVDGDFWHGYRFPLWEHTLPKFWREKIARNRVRDRRTFARLRGQGWIVVRVWEHELKRSPESVVKRIKQKLRKAEKL